MAKKFSIENGPSADALFQALKMSHIRLEFVTIRLGHEIIPDGVPKTRAAGPNYPGHKDWKLTVRGIATNSQEASWVLSGYVMRPAGGQGPQVGTIVFNTKTRKGSIEFLDL